MATLTSLGYEVPTPIQQRTIPLLLEGRDVIGQAQTGTGKTAAFALPILQNMDPVSRKTQALILTPTRELAMQVAEAFHSYAHGMPDISVLPVYGGAPIVNQLRRLERGVQIVVGTPGRLIDHLDRKTLKLDSIRFIVLDEADEMLKMGFLEEVERILGEVPAGRQIALFSATMPAGVARIAERHMANGARVEIEHKAINAPAIEQRFLNVSEFQKLEALTHILELDESDAVLIFRRTKNGAAELCERLQARGFASEAMHGDMNQQQRESVIRRLKNGQIEIVVATDVAARGLDVEQISHVVNYDIPHDVEAYVHRIGRTGRAGRTGVATLFITPRERRMMREIEKFTGVPIKPMKMPSSSDVAARRVAQFKDTLRKSVQQGDLDLYVQLVEQLVEEGPFDVIDVAAAAARLANTARPIGAESQKASEAKDSDREAAPAMRKFERSSEGPSRPKPPDGPRQPGDEKVRLSMAVGKNDGIRPADIVGSIANEAGVPGFEIGPIDIRDEMTIVVIPARYLEQVLAKTARARFRGKAVNLRVAETSDVPSRPPARRFEKSERPSKPYDRPARSADGARPPRTHSSPFKRPFRPRAEGDADQRPADGPARPAFKRPDRPPFKKPDRPPFKKLDRPSAGTFSDRPVKRADRAVRASEPPPTSRPKGGAFARFVRPDRAAASPSPYGRPKFERKGPKGPPKGGPKGKKKPPPR